MTEQTSAPLEQTNSLVSKVAWMIGGFNIGFIILTVLVLIGLPLIAPNYKLQRTSASDNDDNQAVAQVATETATVTLPPSTPTGTPAAIVITATETAVATETSTPFTPEYTSTPTLTPSPFPTETMIPPTPTPQPPPVSYRLEGVTFYQQTWNNCGPANLAMGLSYFNWDGGQDDTASYLKPDREDKNVTPQEMVDYVNEFTNLRAIWRMAGHLEQIKWLIANNFVVIIESGYEPRAEGWFGHYETVISYDNNRETITIYDSYLGSKSNPQVVYDFDRFDRQWQAFNRNYIVIYEPEREAELQQFLGTDWMVHANRRKAVQVAQEEASADPNDEFAWFNLGTSLTAIGRYEEAVVAFEKALEIGLPYRMFWYQFAAYEAYLQTGRLDAVLVLANETLRTTRYVEETFYYKGRVYEIQGDYYAALEQYQLALDFNPNYKAATIAANRVSGLLN